VNGVAYPLGVFDVLKNIRFVLKKEEISSKNFWMYDDIFRVS